MKDPNTAVAINNFRAEVGDMFKSMNKSIDARINNVVEQVINKSLDFHTTTKKKAIEDITVNAPLSVDQLTQLYRQLFNDINDIKSNTTNYALYDQMQVIGKQFEEMRNEFSWVKNTLNQMVADKYIEAGIQPEELEDLYQKSDLSPDFVAKQFNISKEMFLSPDFVAKQFNISKEMFYKVINGKEVNPNEKRKHEMKQFFLKRIFEVQSATV
jgi:archaellum component FlaC